MITIWPSGQLGLWVSDRPGDLGLCKGAYFPLLRVALLQEWLGRLQRLVMATDYDKVGNAKNVNKNNKDNKKKGGNFPNNNTGGSNSSIPISCKLDHSKQGTCNHTLSMYS